MFSQLGGPHRDALLGDDQVRFHFQDVVTNASHLFLRCWLFFGQIFFQLSLEKKGPLLYFKESSLPTIIFQVPSCQFSEEYWSTGSYYLRSSPPLAAGAFPSRILWWSRHWFDLGSIAMDFTETPQGRFLETKVLFTHLDSREFLWAKLLSPFLYSRGQSSKTTLFTGCFMKTQHLAFEMG